MTAGAINTLVAAILFTVLVIVIAYLICSITYHSLINRRDSKRDKLQTLKVKDGERIEIPPDADRILFYREGDSIVVAFEGIYKPAKNSFFYYCFVHEGKVYVESSKWIGDKADLDKLKQGNVFKTREEATKFAELMHENIPQYRALISSKVVKDSKVIQI